MTTLRKAKRAVPAFDDATNDLLPGNLKFMRIIDKTESSDLQTNKKPITTFDAMMVEAVLRLKHGSCYVLSDYVKLRGINMMHREWGSVARNGKTDYVGVQKSLAVFFEGVTRIFEKEFAEYLSQPQIMDTYYVKARDKKKANRKGSFKSSSNNNAGSKGCCASSSSPSSSSSTTTTPSSSSSSSSSPDSSPSTGTEVAMLFQNPEYDFNTNTTTTVMEVGHVQQTDDGILPNAHDIHAPATGDVVSQADGGCTVIRDLSAMRTAGTADSVVASAHQRPQKRRRTKTNAKQEKRQQQQRQQYHPTSNASQVHSDNLLPVSPVKLEAVADDYCRTYTDGKFVSPNVMVSSSALNVPDCTQTPKPLYVTPTSPFLKMKTDDHREEEERTTNDDNNENKAKNEEASARSSGGMLFVQTELVEDEEETARQIVGMLNDPQYASMTFCGLENVNGFVV